MTRRSIWIPALLATAVCIAAPVRAGLLSDPGSAGFSPRVPLSAFARPANWFDPSRLHLSSTVSVGSGWGGTTNALQVTRLSYQFGAPLSMSVSVGNTFGLNSARSGSSFFLEGLDVAWRPSANTLFRVEMRDIRSPLQYSQWGRGFGYDPYAPY